MYTGTYDSNDGSYHAAVELGGEGSQLFKMSAAGIVDQMEKGKAYHMDTVSYTHLDVYKRQHLGWLRRLSLTW